MDLIGDDQSIRALFSELKFVDETTAPGFTATWHRAQARSLQPRRAFKLSFAAATALLVLGLVTMAIWSNRSKPAANVSAYATVPASKDFKATVSKKESQPVDKQENRTSEATAVKVRRSGSVASRRAIEMAGTRKVFNDAKTIESWQSPTASLLSSPSDDLFKSLPQLNENANGMKSFLPGRANDKEK